MKYLPESLWPMANRINSKATWLLDQKEYNEASEYSFTKKAHIYTIGTTNQPVNERPLEDVKNTSPVFGHAFIMPFYGNVVVNFFGVTKHVMPGCCGLNLLYNFYVSAQLTDTEMWKCLQVVLSKDYIPAFCVVKANSIIAPVLNKFALHVLSYRNAIHNSLLQCFIVCPEKTKEYILDFDGKNCPKGVDLKRYYPDWSIFGENTKHPYHF